MKSRTFLVVAIAALGLTGCAGGPMLAEPIVTQPEVHQARQVLSTHRLAPSLNLSENEMLPRLDTVWRSLWPSLVTTCQSVFSHGCQESLSRMRIFLIQDNTVNAFADADAHLIGIHAGLMRSAGDDDEIAAVIAHEAAHLLFGHAQKKNRNALGTQVLAGIIGIGIASQGYGNYTEELMSTGRQVGYLAYSPEMELEADQFAMYVLKHGNRRLSASTDLIVRLARGDVPSPVRQGDGWAGYLQTHPAHDHRLAAIQSTLNDIRSGGIGRPLAKGEHLPLETDTRQAGCRDEFRRRWPNCGSYQGQPDSFGGLGGLWQCGYNIQERYPKLWQLCGAWFWSCHERPETC